MFLLNAGDEVINFSERQSMAQVATYRDTLKPYKFYLSFENTLCKSYITEKFLYTFASKDGPIPIALGGLSTADYERQALHMIMVALTIKNVVYVKGSINRYLCTEVSTLAGLKHLLSTGLVVLGGESCSKGRGFESQCHILDGH